MRDREAEEPKGADEIAAWREVFASERRAAPGPCPPEERLAALAVGEVTGAERTQLADHVVACPRCAETYRTLGELHEAVPAADAPTRRRPTPKRARLLAGAAAAVLVAAAGLGVLYLSGGPSGDGVVRGPGDREVRVEPADGARLAGPPARLSWSFEEGEPGATYRVVLYDAESVPLWRSEPTGDPSVELPSRIGEELTPGTYYWRIRTQRGLDRYATPLLSFEIRP